MNARSGGIPVRVLVLPLILILGVHGIMRNGGCAEPAGRLPADRSVEFPAGIETPSSVAGYSALVPFGSGADAGQVRVSLTPLHAAPARQAFEAGLLRDRYDLPDGEPWLMEVAWTGPAETGDAAGKPSGLSLEAPRVEGGGELALSAPRMSPGTEEDPVVALFGYPRSLDPEMGARILLWGRRPEGEAVAVFGAVRVPLSAIRIPAQESRWIAGEAVGAAAKAASRATSGDDEVASLRRELEQERASRLRRELEWQAFNRTLATLELGSLPSDLRFPGELEDAVQVDPDADGKPAAPDAVSSNDRLEAIERSLLSLLKLEEVRGIDLLEVGRMGRGVVGPVIFRVLDGRGRLAGHLRAESLRLEGSRAGRSLTLVLEDGHEARAGNHVPFEERRITLPYVDPAPWIAAMPELFPTRAIVRARDDGRWDRERVKATLNGLLDQDVAAGHWRLHSLEGVRGADLLEVHLESFDAAGRLEKRVFADRMRITQGERGIELALEDGATVRGDAKETFLGGRTRIFLPRASIGEWTAAGLPGLAAPAELAAPARLDG